MTVKKVTKKFYFDVYLWDIENHKETCSCQPLEFGSMMQGNYTDVVIKMFSFMRETRELLKQHKVYNTCTIQNKKVPYLVEFDEKTNNNDLKKMACSVVNAKIS